MNWTRRAGSFHVVGDGSDELAGLAGSPFASADLPSPPSQLPGLDPAFPPAPPRDNADGGSAEPSFHNLADGNTSGIHDVVCIDSRVPDIQDPLNGLKPGEKAFVIDGSSDGLDQIASILKTEHLTNLTGIQIVSHGAAGELELGATMLNDSDLSVHVNALASIGSALAKGGGLSLYACDTAAGATGQQFIADLSKFTGADVAAATHNVGSAELGGSWTLDASTGPAQTSAPFTDAALSAFDHVLSVQPSEIFVTSFFNTGDPRGVTQASTATPNNSATLTNIGSPLITPAWIALDPAHNVYYVVDTENEGNTGTEQAIFVGAISGTLADGHKLDKIFTLPAADDDLLAGVALDPGTNTLYFAQDGEFNYDPANPTAHPLDLLNGIFSLNLNNLNLASPGGPGTLPETLVAYGPNLGVPQGITLNTANHKVYFIDDSQGGDHATAPILPNATPTNNIYEANIGGTPSLATSILQLNASTSVSGYTQGFLNGIAYDPVNQKLYFTTWDSNDGGLGANVDNVYGESVPAPGTTTLPSALYTASAVAKPFDVRVDAGSGELFIYNRNDAGTSPDAVGSIVRGSVTGGPVSTIFTPAPASPTAEIFGFALDPAPILTTSGGTVTYAEGQSPVQIDTGLTVTALSNPGENLAGATVTIGTGLDSSHDVLGFTAQNGISVASNSGGVLTLTGVASVAAYQAALESVTFSTTSSSAAQRSISFTVTDSVVTSAAASSDHVNVLTPPVALPDTNNAVELGAAATGTCSPTTPTRMASR